MTGPPQLRPAAGWLARRLTALADDVRAWVTPRPATLPPRRLRARVGAPGVSEFCAGGEAAVAALTAALAPRAIGDFASVLDFGCGSGRVLTHLRRANPSAALTGVDVDPEAISWAAGHLEGIHVERSPTLPPLPFADGAFDLIVAISVFSHLDQRAQDAWLGEIARVLAPGGVALLSTHGASAYEAFRAQAVRTVWCDPEAFIARGPLPADGLVAIPYRASRWSAGDLPGVGEGYGLTFHGEEYIRVHWGAVLEIEAILPRAISDWQDLVVAGLRRPGPDRSRGGGDRA